MKNDNEEEQTQPEEKQTQAAETTAVQVVDVNPSDVQVEVAEPKSDADKRGLASGAVPILRRLRSRIRSYAALWATAGGLTLLLAAPAFREKSYVLGSAILLFAGCIVFFAMMRSAEAKSISAIIEADRSEMRRKVFLAMNTVVFVLSLVVFVISLVWAPASLNPWIALPISSFVMVVSLSPVWEWFFIRRVIASNRDMLEEFNRYMTLIYKTRSERQMALVALDALNSLDQLREEKLLSHATYQAVLFELMGFGSAPGVSVSGKPW